MSFSHTYSFNWSDGASNISSSTTIGPFESEFMTDQSAEATGDGSTHNIGVTLTAANLKSVFLLSTQNVTVKFYNGSTTVNIALTANIPWFWYSGSAIANPLASLTTITAIQTNNPASVSSSNDATVKVRILYNTNS